MFVKLTQIKEYCYVKIVESYRDDKGVTRHSTICSFGRLDRLKKDKSFVKSITKLYALVNDLDPDAVLASLNNGDASAKSEPAAEAEETAEKAAE